MTVAESPEEPSRHEESRHEESRRSRDVREVLTVVLLSVTAVLTAWCGFESSKWGGEMSIAFSQASSARVQAVGAAAEARDARSVDLAIYTQWIDAVAQGKTRLATYIEDRFTPTFATAFEDWNAHDRRLPSPFAEPSYVPAGTDEAQQLSSTADAKFQKGLDNNAQGDQYSLLTVLFALVLFFAAMSGRSFPTWAARTLLGFAVVLAVVGVSILATFPVIV